MDRIFHSGDLLSGNGRTRIRGSRNIRVTLGIIILVLAYTLIFPAAVMAGQAYSSAAGSLQTESLDQAGSLQTWSGADVSRTQMDNNAGSAQTPLQQNGNGNGAQVPQGGSSLQGSQQDSSMETGQAQVIQSNKEPDGQAALNEAGRDPAQTIKRSGTQAAAGMARVRTIGSGNFPDLFIIPLFAMVIIVAAFCTIMTQEFKEERRRRKKGRRNET
ncbi:MAG: hypothetical protein IJH81_04385 [Lachnospiraceae bacterium]|nr:hypothetical protein [Lachnospiraceae bacterium]